LIDHNGQNSSNDLNSTIAQLGINPNGIQVPTVENLTYDSSTGIATLTLNITNPLTDQSLEVSNFSLTVAFSNGTQPVTIQLVEPINIAANQTGDISIPLISSNPVVLQSLISGDQTVSNLQLSNLYVNVNGIIVQVGNLNGLFQSGNSNSNNNGNNNNSGSNVVRIVGGGTNSNGGNVVPIIGGSNNIVGVGR